MTYIEHKSTAARFARARERYSRAHAACETTAKVGRDVRFAKLALLINQI